MTPDIAKLAEHFPQERVHWRAQNMTADGSKAMELAYIDARDVMDRLDAVIGSQNWQDAYVESARGRVICTLSIKIGGEWISKSDGAGDTDYEGEKGGISDAFKRAAVKWGVGRYLYRMDAVWVPCEFYEKQGKKHWKAWKQSPWQSVRKPKPTPQQADASPSSRIITADQLAELQGLVDATQSDAGAMCKYYNVSSLKQLPGDRFADAKARLEAKRKDVA